ncbi:MAG: cardiolipin synthase [Marinilabiliaceae bacterium]
MFFLSNIFTSSVLPVILAGYAISILVVVVLIVLENRSPLKTISWILVLLLLPGLGFLLYIFFGQNFRKEKIIARKGLRNHHRLNYLAHSQIQQLTGGELDSSEVKIGVTGTVRLLLNNSSAIVTSCNDISFFHRGRDKFKALIGELEKAKRFIHLEYYIFAEDNIGTTIKNILKKKASQGVEVRLIVDDVGSWELKQSFFDEMEQAGVEAYSFLKVRFPLLTSKVNYRNHRKIVIIDGHTGFIGGYNIADRYKDGEKSRYGIWRDTHIMIKGDAVNSLQSVFLTDWYFVSQTELTETKYFPAHKPASESKIMQIAASGPDSDWAGIMMGIFQVITTARDYLYIATPYFMPNESVLMALKVSALSGVDVRVIIPERSDAVVALLCSRSYIRELLEAGVQIYFYKKGFLHCKTLVADDKTSIVGSANMDFRSFEQNFEVSAFIYDEETALELKKTFLKDQAESEIVLLPEWMDRSYLEKAKESFARLFSPLL